MARAARVRSRGAGGPIRRLGRAGGGGARQGRETRTRAVVARIRGVHLDCTEAKLEEKMRGLLDEGRRESGPGWSCRVALEKNALGLCETGNALVALERRGDGEGSGSPDEVATWLGDRMEAAAETEGFFRGLECSGAVDEEAFAGLVSQGRVEGGPLGGANLDQRRKALEEMEEEFRVFENNSY